MRPATHARIRAVLDIPDRYAIPMVVATGYPAPEAAVEGASKPRRWRYPPDEVVFENSFGVAMEGIKPPFP